MYKGLSKTGNIYVTEGEKGWENLQICGMSLMEIVKIVGMILGPCGIQSEKIEQGQFNGVWRHVESDWNNISMKNYIDTMPKHYLAIIFLPNKLGCYSIYFLHLYFINEFSLGYFYSVTNL